MWALRGVSSAGLERLPVTQKVEGSSPLHPASFICRHLSGRYYKVSAPSSRGLGHRPFKARTTVRIRLGLPK